MSEDGPKTTSTSRIQTTSNRVAWAVFAVIVLYLACLGLGLFPHPDPSERAEGGHSHSHEAFVPPMWAVLPFVALLLAIAVLPLLRRTEHWWHSNRNRFLVASGFSLMTLIYYGLLHPGGVQDHFGHGGLSAAGLNTVSTVFSNAFFTEYTPFIILLFSLYVISGGISLRGDLPAYPRINCAFIGAGTLLASFIGTTGSAMVFIRPLLASNSERRYKVHTVVFFIFMVCNCGGLLLPIGDPPLFLGYLRGVPFTWTLGLWPYWLGVNLILLLLYYIWDRVMYSREPVRHIVRDQTQIRPLRLTGRINFLLISGVVLSAAFLVPGKPFLGTSFVPPHFFREMIMLLLVIASLKLTETEARFWNRFDYHAILEVGALFFGIFICMQVPIEILNARGSSLGIDSGFSFFWATGLLSSFLDNAPTYVVFFETAASLTPTSGALLELVGGRELLETFLVSVSLGAVFMGANTYIGNGPNFMVKSIAERSGVKMPSFFGYMVYSTLILVPVWLLLSFLL